MSSPWLERRVRLSSGRWLGFAEYGDPAGRPVFYFHGGLSSRLDAAFASPACAALGVRLIAIDRPGIGLSDFQPRRTLLDWPDAMAEIAAELGIERFAALGWSAGAPYVLACALRIPHLLTHAATVGCPAPIDGPGALEEYIGYRTDRILVRLVRTAPWLASLLLSRSARLPAWLIKRSVLANVVDPASRAAIAAAPAREAVAFFTEAFRSGARGTVQDYRVFSAAWGFRPEDIQFEILLYQGEEDRLARMNNAHYLARHLPHSRLIVLPGQGHFLLHEKMGEVLAALTA